MVTKVERAKHTIAVATRKNNLALMIEQVKLAQKNNAPLKMYYKGNDGLTRTITAYPVEPLQEL